MKHEIYPPGPVHPNFHDRRPEKVETKIISSPAVKQQCFLSLSIFLSAIILAGAWIYTTGLKTGPRPKAGIVSRQEQVPTSELEDKVLPVAGITLPVTWGDLGVRLVGAGVIDADKWKAIYEQRGQFTDEYRDLLLKSDNDRLKITRANAGYLLNLFWALGLASQNSILDKGEMMDPAYGGVGHFASTGGWTIARGRAMDHYGRHRFFNLTPTQQALVEKISQGVYRPCCGNSAHFPDCNHGMAMLGLLELMAVRGVSESEMWRTALTVNAYWFPDNYLTIATYLKTQGVDWPAANPQEILGAAYSSGQGYAKIAAQVAQPRPQNGGDNLPANGQGCDVGGGQPTAPQQRQGGCGI